MKVSIITAVYNREKSIRNAIESIKSQTYPKIESVCVDGGSNDATVEIIKKEIPQAILISEPDRGIYDALNKGMSLSTGDVIGVLHSDDVFKNSQVIEKIVGAFESFDIDVLYGDLQYVSKSNPSKVLRNWKAGIFRKNKLHAGWMPPHPTVFVSRRVIEVIGGYDINYKISGDYDWLVRVLRAQEFKIFYLPEVLVVMSAGGASNKSVKSVITKMREDYQVICKHGLGGVSTLFKKNLIKLPQLFLRTKKV